METETEDEFLLICDGSSGSFSSSVSLSDRSVDNILEEYNCDAPFAGKVYFKIIYSICRCIYLKRMLYYWYIVVKTYRRKVTFSEI